MPPWQPKSLICALTNSYARIPSHFQQLHNGLNSSRTWWRIGITGGKITWSVYQHKRWLLLTTAATLLAWNLTSRVTKKRATVHLRTTYFWGKKCKLHQRHVFCIFTRYSGDNPRMWWTGSKHVCRIGFGIMRIKNYSNRFIIDGVVQKN